MSVTTLKQQTVPKKTMIVSNVVNATLKTSSATIATILNSKEEAFRTRATKDIKKTITNATTKNLFNWLKNTKTTTTTTTPTRAVEIESDATTIPIVSTDNSKVNDTNLYETNIKSETLFCSDRDCTCLRHKFKKSTRCKYKKYNNTKKTHNNNNNNSNNNNSYSYSNDDTNNCSLLTISPLNQNQNQNNKTDETLREFSGVQTLKRFWNKRLTANKDSNHLTKSVDCLINSIDTPTLPTQLLQSELNEHASKQIARKTRTQSLHDCSPLDQNYCHSDSLESLKPILTDFDFHIHLAKDNFYKYKTAEQALKLRQQSERYVKRTNHCDKKIMLDPKILINPSEHWLKGQQRKNSPKQKLSHEIITDMAKSESTDNSQSDDGDNSPVSSESTDTTTNISIDNDHQTIYLRNEKLEELPIKLDSQIDIANNYTGILNTNFDITLSQCANSHQQRTTVRLKCSNNNNNNNNSNNQKIGNELIKKSGNNPQRYLSTKRSPAFVTTRKYSFKTHSRSSPRFYSCATRKMILKNTYHNSNSKIESQLCQLPSPPPSTSTSTSSSSSTTTSISVGDIKNQFSLVAQLTQQFNAIIRKDNTLLNDIKRKNGILMTRGGHIYKVIQTATFTKKLHDHNHYLNRFNSRPNDKVDNDCKIQKQQQKQQQQIEKEEEYIKRKTSPSNVQRTIKKFERCKLSNADTVKPKVPAKSLQVLQKRTELVLKNRQQLSQQIKQTMKMKSNDKQICTKDELNDHMTLCSREEVNDFVQIDSCNKELVPTINEIEIKKEDVDNSTKLCKQIDSDDKQETFLLREENQDQKSLEENSACNKEYKTTLCFPHEILKETQEKANSKESHQDSHCTESEENKESTAIIPEAPQDLDKNLNVSSNSEVDIGDDFIDEVKQRQRKQKYAEIYEKIRFRTPFFLNKASPKKYAEETDNSDISIHANNENFNITEDFKILQISNSADEHVDKKLDHISFDNMNINESISEFISNLDNKYDNNETRLVPNKSFIYSESSSLSPTNLNVNVKDDPLEKIAQAVNIILVKHRETKEEGKAEAEKEEEDNVFIECYNKIKIEEDQEPLYEPIEVQDQCQERVEDQQQQQHIIGSKAQLFNKEIDIPVTQLPLTAPTTSFLYKIYNDRLELCKKNNGNICEVSKNSLLGSVDDIYQTIEETLQSSQTNSNASPFLTHQTKINQTIDDYEIIEDTLTKQMEKNFKFLKSTSNLSSTTYDGYEECSPQPLKQELPFLSPLSITKDINAIGKISVNHQSTMAVRNTNDELPELPELPELSKSKMYSIKTPLPIRKSNTKSLNSTVITINHNDDNEENIYDTIKGSDCYESLQPLDRSVNAKDDNNITDDDHDKIRSNAAIISCDTFSLTSNCYESISHYCPSNLSMNVERKLNGGGGDGVGGSTLTLLSADQKTNSLYEDSSSLLNNLLRYNSSNNRILDNNISLVKDFRNNRNSYNNMKYLQRHSLRSDSDACNNNNKSGSSTSSGSIIYILGSDNSDEWMDIADNENEEGRQSQLEEQEREQEEQPKFIVIRERVKAYKSPMWSKRVREKRLHYQRKSTSCIEDDSDHYYEQLSIYNGSKKRHSLNVEDNYKNNNQLRRNRVRLSQKGKRHSYSAQTLGQTIITPDEYDSFDTDFEEIGESEHGTENYLKDMDTYNDSGVDMRNIKLPELPSPVAGNANTHSNTNQMYAIVKRFKNFIVNKKSPNNSKHKIYDNASQFYVMNNKNINNNATLSPVATTTLTTTSKIESPKCSLNKELSNSERNLLACQSDITKYEPKNTIASNNITTTTTTPRTKTKPNKSLRARIRKSLVGFDNKPLIIPAPSNARSTFYVEKLNSTSLQLQQQQQQQDDTPGEMDSGFSEKVPSTDGTFSESTSEEIPISQQDQNLHNASTLKHKCSTREIKLSHSQRRRTTIGIRPQDPPPPPPPPTSTERENNVNRHNQTNTTSWYAECGVFKSSTTTQLNSDEAHFLKGVGKNNHNLSPSDNIIACGSSWYEEVGLYQTSGLSEASGSSSGSSGVSTGNEVSPVDDLAPSTMFNNEPLYQIYTAAKLEAISRDLGETDRDNNSMDGYEEVGIGRVNTVDGQDTQTADEHRTSVRPSALQLVEPKSGPSRTLWCQIPEVINSCILDTMTSRERALMEAKFEIITSEASYMKSLNLLRTHYMNHPIFRDSNHLNTRDRKALFSQIVPVHECSEKLLTELESCWQDNIMLVGLSRRIYKMAEKHFHVYVGFCENQGRMDRTLKRLRETKGLFSQNLELLESSPTSCGLSLHSFLMLPMQRITRLPLLIDAVFSKCHPNDDEYENWKLCLAIINKIVTQCNEAANRCEQAYELEKISRQLEFNAAVIRPLAIAPVGVTALGAKPRYLVKRGELTHIIWRGEDAKLTFGKKFTKSNIYAFLFSDLLVLTKRKGDELFSVFDYCPRSMLTISPGDSLPQLPTKDLNSQTNKNLILMTLLENHERKTVEMILSCPSVSEQERWLQTMKPLTAETPGEKLYEQWDCPQVIAKHAYTSNEPDVLNLEIGDVINVTRKLPDGWYQGERIRDSAVGWFPGAYAEEVNSAHVRARNLKQRHRLLTFTATYLELQKRHK